MTLADDNNHFAELNFLFRFLIRFVSAIIGGVLIVIVVIALINVLFFALDYFDVMEKRRQIVFPPRAVFTFVIGAYIFWRRTPKIYNGLIDRFRNSQRFRFLILLSLFYVVCLLSYIQLFEPRPFSRGLEFLLEPYRYGRLAKGVEEFLKLLLYPICVFAFGSYLLGKAKVSTANNDDES